MLRISDLTYIFSPINLSAITFEAVIVVSLLFKFISFALILELLLISFSSNKYSLFDIVFNSLNSFVFLFVINNLSESILNSSSIFKLEDTIFVSFDLINIFLALMVLLSIFSSFTNISV